jgi:hypothetical protein
MSTRAYPLPRPEGDDPRFNFGLLHEVAKVIEDAGYPPLTNGTDLVDLRGVLFGFLYSKETADQVTT